MNLPRSSEQKRIVSLILLLISVAFVAFALPGCLTAPGIEEPRLEQICVVIDGVVADCQTPEQKHFDLPVASMIGWACVRPSDFGQVKSHHEILHREINRLTEEKK